MYSLVLKIVHNTRIKDSIAILRGLYRTSQGAFPHSSSDKVRKSSWMDQPPIHHINSQANATNQIYKQTSDKFNTNKERTKQNIINTETNINGRKSQKNYLKQLKNMNKKEIDINQPKIQPQISAIPSSRISRILQFGKLGISLASASILARDKDSLYYQDVAEKVSKQLCQMRGAPLKLAQMLSIQQDNLIPAPIRKAFQKARQSAHIIPVQQVELMLQKNLGLEWTNRFKQFNKVPFASASIGQVHRAVLLNGEQVAVKIQYHRVRQSINSDIQNLKLLLKLPGLFPKGMYVQRILMKTKEELMQECDYKLQKFYQQKYQEYLVKSFGNQESKLYKIPKIFPQYTTSQILCSEYITGTKMKQLQQGQYPQELRDEIGRRIMKLTFKQLFQMGIMQSDPNPSNYTYNHIKDELNLYDFGATHIYKKQFLQNYYKIIEGSVERNPEKIWQSSIKTGFVTGEENAAMKSGHIESIMITGEPLRFAGNYNFGQQQITKRIYKTIPLMLKNRIKAPPQQVYSLHRKLSGSYLACIRLKARVDCSKIFKEIKFQAMASNQKYQSVSI